MDNYWKNSIHQASDTIKKLKKRKLSLEKQLDNVQQSIRYHSLKKKEYQDNYERYEKPFENK